MAIRQFFLSCRQDELPAFLRVFGALREESLDYRPHPNSPSAAQIVSTMVNELRACVELAHQGETDWAPRAPEALGVMTAAFERHHADLQSRVESLADEDWTRPVRFLVQGEVKMERPLGELLWFFHFDAIHHRGQLSTYIRPMGGLVPSIYGPSADSAKGSGSG